jgi:hypothetical protein
MKLRFLLSTQRSGSHFLKNVIEQYFPSVVCSTEILGPPGEGSVGYAALQHLENSYFWPWYETRIKAGLLTAAPNHRVPAFREFLAELFASVVPRDLLVDIKYNSARSLSGYWDTEIVSHDFVSFVTGTGIPVLNLIRRNILKTIISNHLARTTGVWHRTQNRLAGETSPKLNLPPKQLLLDVRYAARVVDSYQGCFSSYEAYAEVFYEDIVQEHQQARQGRGLRTLERFFEQKAVTPVNSNTVFKKTTPDNPADVVENWEEIVRLFAHTEFGWMTQEPMRAAA